MNRRKILTLGLMTALALPLSVLAKDYRVEKPSVWTAHTVNDALKALYGDVDFKKSDNITLNLPKIASNGMIVPVKIKSSIKAKSVSLFQNSNPESAVAVWSVPKAGVVDYGLKIKIKGKENTPSIVTVVVEGKDGKMYLQNESITVSSTTCEG